MGKIFWTLVCLAILATLIFNDPWRVTLDTSDYSISMSFVLCLFCLCVLGWLLAFVKKPFQWWHQFQNFRHKKRQEKRNAYLSEVLTAFLAHNVKDYSPLLHQAQKLYGTGSKEFLLVSALLQPQSEVFQSLNATESETTKLVGLYGLIQEAETAGDFQQMAELLQQVPPTFKQTPWVQQTMSRLALSQRDWAEALRLVEQAKRYLPKAKYRAQKACLLLKLGKIKEAYNTDDTHPAIALAYAHFVPKKALKILKQAWKETPSWPIYQAIKKHLQSMPEKKRLKILLDLTRETRDERASLLARADMDMELQNWLRAKENLEIYINKYPLTRQVADMMATIERTAWHHEPVAQDWERKGVEAEDDTVWFCRNCGHTMNDWQILCPHCNAFDELYLK